MPVNTLYRCRLCHRIFEDEESLDDHLKDCRGKVPCPHCGRELLPPSLGAHLRRRKEIGRCPVPQGHGRTRGVPKKKKRKGSAYMREWNKAQKAEGKSWSMLQDVEGMS